MPDIKNLSIQEIYQQRRQRAKNLFVKRQEKVAETIYGWQEFERERHQKITTLARNALASEAGEKELQDYIDDVAKRRKKMLTDAGFPEDFLEMKYFCEKCEDTGWLDNYQRCSCYDETFSRQELARSNLSEVLERENFDFFDMELFSVEPMVEGMSPRENMANLVRASHEFIRDFPDVKSVVFHGDPGTGKTFLAHCIANELIDKQVSMVYHTAHDLVETFEDHQFSMEEDPLADERYRRLFQADLLIIDDLGTELINTFSTGELFHLLNSRINEKKTTIISTNLSVPAIGEYYSERILSRIIQHFDLWYFFGDDIRIKFA